MPKTNSYKILAKFEESQTCNLCLTNRVDDFNLGKIYKLADIIVHYFCLTCCYCKKKGATVICASKRCIKSFHLTCGLDKGSMHQFFDAFKSYCGLHRPKQKIPVSVRKSTSDLCVICACAIDLRSQNTYLWPSCCKAFSFLHRDCVQKLASSAGYYFKCPLCNNTRNFQGAMRFYGIYIPEQEASWETEPNAYEDLLVRHQKCEADICCCPRGRMYSKKNS
ncbi:hypothetical protein AAG570_011259 [Ranatra chinensis]|uniref:PHD-type domain-containing protein n=1 Tax=Ranatra chinensis TaxID=642074 RepID=A0ABD0YKD2_9HEMI